MAGHFGSGLFDKFQLNGLAEKTKKASDLLIKGRLLFYSCSAPALVEP